MIWTPLKRLWTPDRCERCGKLKPSRPRFAPFWRGGRRAVNVGNTIQVGPDDAIRVNNDAIVVAGAGDLCCCNVTGACCLESVPNSISLQIEDFTNAEWPDPCGRNFFNENPVTGLSYIPCTQCFPAGSPPSYATGCNPGFDAPYCPDPLDPNQPCTWFLFDGDPLAATYTLDRVTSPSVVTCVYTGVGRELGLISTTANPMYCAGEADPLGGETAVLAMEVSIRGARVGDPGSLRVSVFAVAASGNPARIPVAFIGEAFDNGCPDDVNTCAEASVCHHGLFGTTDCSQQNNTTTLAYHFGRIKNVTITP